MKYNEDHDQMASCTFEQASYFIHFTLLSDKNRTIIMDIKQSRVLKIQSA